MVTAAFLAHLGNEKSSYKLLSKSATVMAYYRKMSLEDKSTRALLVTMVTAMNPLFAEMIRSTIKIAMERVADENRSIYDEVRLNDAFTMLSKSGSVSNDEMRILGPRVKTIEIPSSSSFPQSTIGPDDSASIVAKSVSRSPPMRRVTGQKDLMDFIKERRHSRGNSFDETFPSEKKPVRMNAVKRRHGIGYNDEEDDMSTVIAKVLENMNVNADKTKVMSSSPTEQYCYTTPPLGKENSFDRTPKNFYNNNNQAFVSSPPADSNISFNLPSLSSENMLNYNTDQMRRAHIGMSNNSFAGSLEDLV
jgi:hypothetical protein